jgi:hypothetical protein
MDVGTPCWRAPDLLKASEQILFYLRLLIAALCLLGIGFLLWFYISQNNLVAEAFRDLSSQVEGNGSLTPADLAELSHKACVLDVSISNMGSFLQPLSATLSDGGWCGNYVRVFIRFVEEEGYSAHKFHIQSGGRYHTLAEVYYKGGWRIIDPFFNQVYLLPNGEMATFQDLAESPNLLKTPAQRPLKNPRLEEIYLRYEPIFPALYRDAPDFYPALSRSAFYHNTFVLLSYPLSLFYEGGRRPILPTWLDRPELLGVYGLSALFLAAVGPTGIRQIRRLGHPKEQRTERPA